jgi:N-acetylglucosamine repressor
MDAHRGIVINSVNMGWQNLPLQDLLKKRYALPVYIANDSQVAALAEFTFGESKRLPNLVLIKIGRGVGAGVILNQQLYYGDDGYGAGEIGHVRVVENGDRCLCGHTGCLETLVSSRAIVKQARAIARQNERSILYQFAATPREIDIEVVARALDVDDPNSDGAAVQALVDRAGAYLGQAIANLVGALGIRRIVLGGSVTCLGQKLLEPIRQQIGQCALAALADETHVCLSNLGLDIVLLGAAALVLSNELGII